MADCGCRDNIAAEEKSRVSDTSDEDPRESENNSGVGGTANLKGGDPTITLEVEVPAPGATRDQVEMYRQMADLFAERFETFVSKNLDYGSSFLTAGEVDAVLDTGDGPFADAKTANLYKLFTRIQDKDQRFYNLAFCGSQDRVGESAAETAGDAGVYWFMVEWLLRHG